MLAEHISDNIDGGGEAPSPYQFTDNEAYSSNDTDKQVLRQEVNKSESCIDDSPDFEEPKKRCPDDTGTTTQPVLQRKELGKLLKPQGQDHDK